VNNELKELLQSVLQAELNPIKETIKRLDSDMKQQFDDVNKRLKNIENGIYRIEEGQPEDIKAILTTISNKIDQHDDHAHVLNKRLFQMESKVERLSKQ
jgi:gas vesicle protein